MGCLQPPNHGLASSRYGSARHLPRRENEGSIACHMGCVVFIPLARGRAATRAILWAVPALLLGAMLAVIYNRLQFRPTAVSSGIVDYAVAIAALPLVGFAVFCVGRMMQYFLAVVWPGPLGLHADGEYLQLFLGPFGNHCYRADELEIRYPFEMESDDEGGRFEQFLPEGEQLARILPRISHRTAKVPINRIILGFIGGDEPGIASRLRRVIEHWRRGRKLSA